MLGFIEFQDVKLKKKNEDFHQRVAADVIIFLKKK